MKAFSLKTVDKFTDMNMSEILLLRYILLRQQSVDGNFVILDIKENVSTGLGKSSWYNAIKRLISLELISTTHNISRFKISDDLFVEVKE